MYRTMGDFDGDKFGLDHEPDRVKDEFELEEGEKAYVLVGCDGFTDITLALRETSNLRAIAEIRERGKTPVISHGGRSIALSEDFIKLAGQPDPIAAMEYFVANSFEQSLQQAAQDKSNIAENLALWGYQLSRDNILVAVTEVGATPQASFGFDGHVPGHGKVQVAELSTDMPSVSEKVIEKLKASPELKKQPETKEVKLEAAPAYSYFEKCIKMLLIKEGKPIDPNGNYLSELNHIQPEKIFRLFDYYLTPVNENHARPTEAVPDYKETLDNLSLRFLKNKELVELSLKNLSKAFADDPAVKQFWNKMLDMNPGKESQIKTMEKQFFTGLRDKFVQVIKENSRKELSPLLQYRALDLVYNHRKSSHKDYREEIMNAFGEISISKSLLDSFQKQWNQWKKDKKLNSDNEALIFLDSKSITDHTYMRKVAKILQEAANYKQDKELFDSKRPIKTEPEAESKDTPSLGFLVKTHNFCEKKGLSSFMNEIDACHNAYIKGYCTAKQAHDLGLKIIKSIIDANQPKKLFGLFGNPPKPDFVVALEKIVDDAEKPQISAAARPK